IVQQAGDDARQIKTAYRIVPVEQTVRLGVQIAPLQQTPHRAVRPMVRRNIGRLGQHASGDQDQQQAREQSFTKHLHIVSPPHGNADPIRTLHRAASRTKTKAPSVSTSTAVPSSRAMSAACASGSRYGCSSTVTSRSAVVPGATARNRTAASVSV